MNLKPLEILRRSEEIDDLEVKADKVSTPEEKVRLLEELKAMLHRLENDLP